MRGKIRDMCERGETCGSNHSAGFHASSISQFYVKFFPITCQQFHIGLVDIWHIFLLVPLAIVEKSLDGHLSLLEDVLHLAKAVKRVCMSRVANSDRTPGGL